MYAWRNPFEFNLGRQRGVHDSAVRKVVDPVNILNNRCKSAREVGEVFNAK
jgi:hypothetical protein